MKWKRTLAAAFVVSSITLLSVNVADATGPKQISIVAMPHEDDETQGWSLIENSTGNYKVFAFFTQGEETGYCKTASGLDTAHGEVAPTYKLPTGSWTEKCKKNRINSTLQFLNKMALTDSSLPRGFNINAPIVHNYGQPSGWSVGHYDNVTKKAPSTNKDLNGTFVPDSTITQYKATNGYGTALFFDLGDGDLTKNEVIWGINSILNHRSSLGLPGLPFYNIIGPFRNASYSSCFHYEHNDHTVIHQALFDHNFHVKGYQTAATCATDPDVKRTKYVTYSHWENAWAMSGTQRVGYGQKYYGWLSGDPYGISVASNSSQSPGKAYMRRQSFWQRF